MKNIIIFMILEANILNSTENEIIVPVPYGAYYAPIFVYTNGLYATSSQRFNLTFNATEELIVAHLSNQLDNPYLGAKYYDIKIADLNGDEIPEIVEPTMHGMVEVMRGCGRGCKFCDVTLRSLRYYPVEKVKKEIEGQIKIASAYSELGLYQYCPDKIEDWRKRLRTVAESIKILPSE